MLFLNMPPVEFLAILATERECSRTSSPGSIVASRLAPLPLMTDLAPHVLIVAPIVNNHWKRVAFRGNRSNNRPYNPPTARDMANRVELTRSHINKNNRGQFWTVPLFCMAAYCLTPQKREKRDFFPQLLGREEDQWLLTLVSQRWFWLLKGLTK